MTVLLFETIKDVENSGQENYQSQDDKHGGFSPQPPRYKCPVQHDQPGQNPNDAGQQGQPPGTFTGKAPAQTDEPLLSQKSPIKLPRNQRVLSGQKNKTVPRLIAKTPLNNITQNAILPPMDRYYSFSENNFDS